MDDVRQQPLTHAVFRILLDEHDPATRSDLLFLEAWQMNPPANLGATLRASQIRRANPGLVAEIERELKGGAKPVGLGRSAAMPSWKRYRSRPPETEGMEHRSRAN
jgi:hypothetical protein